MPGRTPSIWYFLARDGAIVVPPHHQVERNQNKLASHRGSSLTEGVASTERNVASTAQGRKLGKPLLATPTLRPTWGLGNWRLTGVKRTNNIGNVDT